MIPFKNEPGWSGAFTRDHAKGALPNGSRIVKVMDEPGDGHKAGSLGTVLGSIRTPPDFPFRYFYFIEFDNTPKRAVAVMGTKISDLNEN